MARLRFIGLEKLSRLTITGPQMRDQFHKSLASFAPKAQRIVSKAAPKWRGRLGKSFQVKATKKPLGLSIKSRSKYALIRDRGGEFGPRNAGALAIPVSLRSKGKSVRQFGPLFMIKVRSKAYLVRRTGRGKRSQLEFLFKLQRRVKQEGTHYLSKAQRQITREAKEHIKKRFNARRR